MIWYDINYIPQRCQFCGKTFTDRSNKNRHIRANHRNIVTKYKCMLCYRLCYSFDSLKRHAIRTHAGFIDMDILEWPNVGMSSILYVYNCSIFIQI